MINNNLFHDIQVYLILGMILLLLIAAAGFVLYYLYSRKTKSMSEINYDYFNRKDSLEYCKFDEIISSNPDDFMKGAGAIVRNRNTFIGILQVTGLNFYSASYTEQEHTISAFISLIDALEYRVQFRQTSKAIDISHNIEDFTNILEDLKSQIAETDALMKHYLELSEDNIDNEELSASYIAEFDKLASKQEVNNRKAQECQEVINYMEQISSASSDTQQVHNIIYSYDFDETQFTASLTREEIELQALNTLDTRGAALISNLVRCGCSARRLTAGEIVELMRRHLHPVTADENSVDELLNSDLSALYVTSDTLLERIKTRLTDEEYQKRQAIHEQELNEMLKRENLKSRKKENDLLESAEDLVQRTLYAM